MKQVRFSFQVSAAGSAQGIREDENNVYPGLLRAQTERIRRRRTGAAILLTVSLLAIFLLAKHATGSAVVWGLASVAAGILTSTIILIFCPKLACPACGKRLEPAKGRHCPECGSDRFEFGRHKRGTGWWRVVYCPACESDIGEAMGDDPRDYRIRSCTHCGVRLTERGV